MAAPGFGFSVGDFVAAIQLIGKVSKALKDTGGAEDDFRFLFQELSQLQVVLEQLRDLPPGASASQNHTNAVKGMALAVQVPLQEFLDKIEKFKVAFDGPKSHFIELRKAGRKTQWAVTMQEEVNKIRGVLTIKIVTISLLLALPSGEILNRLDRRSEETYSLQKRIEDIVEESKQQATIQTEDIKAEIRNTNSGIRNDTSTLLKVCAGLRVGVRRFEKQSLLFQSKTSEQNQLILSELRNNSAVTVRSAAHARMMGWQLLQRFTSFSAEVLQYLKSLHNSNMEIYELLRRIQNTLSRPLTEIHSDDITFIDALNRRYNLPYAYFQDQEVFESMLRCKFRDLPGAEKVNKGEYTIKNSKISGRMIRRPDWNRLVFPGMILQMMIILKLFRASEVACPRTKCTGSGRLDLSSDVMSCTRCQLQWVPDFKDISNIDEMWSYVSELAGPSTHQQDSSTTPSISQPTLSLAEDDEDLLNVFQNVQIAKASKSAGLEAYSTVESANQASKIPTRDPRFEIHSSSSQISNPHSKNPKQPIRGILRKPTEQFPEDLDTSRSGVAPLKPSKTKGIPSGARWTKIDRQLVNPQALVEKEERFEERKDCVIVLRVLTKDEIQEYADRTRHIREMRAASAQYGHQDDAWVGTTKSQRPGIDRDRVIASKNLVRPSNNRKSYPLPLRADESSFSYTDPAGMYRDTEPRQRHRRESLELLPRP